MKRFLILMAALIGFSVASAADAERKIGIVLLHGKLGASLGSSYGRSPIGIGLIDALQHAGYLVATPEMCWSGRRNFDRTYTDCFHDVDVAVAELKAKGAAGIIVGGLSLGGNAAIGYGATHSGLLGIIALAPADDPRLKAKRPEIAAVIAQARDLHSATAPLGQVPKLDRIQPLTATAAERASGQQAVGVCNGS